MTADQFRVSEHFSYDMIGTWYYEVFRNSLRSKDSSERMSNFMRESVEPLNCQLRLFPDYQFNAQEFAKR